MSQNISFANWLSAMLDKKSISKAALARGVGVSRATVTEWCNGNVAAPSDFNRKKVENFFKDCGSNIEETVVIKHQAQIEVFANADGGITIRQCGWPDEDSIVCFAVEHTESICNAIQDVSKSIKGCK